MEVKMNTLLVTPKRYEIDIEDNQKLMEQRDALSN